MKILIILSVMINYISYFWSVIGVFKSHNESETYKYRILQTFSLAFWIYTTVRLFQFEEAAFSSIWNVISLILFALILIGFWYNSRIVKQSGFTIVFSKDVPQKIETRGFYRWIRHPFYCLYILCYWNVTFIINDIISMFLALGLTVIYVHAALTEEKKFLTSPLKEVYLEYKNRSGMFFPKL
jgi:protein-S-isoprenylcysteine O-methyltransferase Ste14